MSEVWRDIKGFEGLYQVSNMGRVRYHDTWITRSYPNGTTASYRTRKGSIKSLFLNSYGYSVELNKGVKKKVRIKCDETVSLLLPKNSSEEISRTVEFNKNITAPIEKGDVLGYVNVFSGENQVGKLPVKATEPVKRLTFLYTFGHILTCIFKI
jgi:D-alanyl-D-alanine carboxypeptidase